MNLIRPFTERLTAYVPGEQPKIQGLIKLNTNENPYPPSPRVLEEIKKAVDSRLRLYPNPTADALRDKLAEYHNCHRDNIIVGNGSDEILAMAVRGFLDPSIDCLFPANTSEVGNIQSKQCEASCSLQYLWPCYSLYPILATNHGVKVNPVLLHPDFSLPSIHELKMGQKWDFQAALTFITTPNAPSGRGYSTAELELFCQAQQGIVLLDETYVDFANEHAMSLALKYPNVLVARTFSKAYSLCFQRVGYCVGPKPLIDALHKIRDSYNVNGLGQIAALATLNDLEYYQQNFRRIIATRKFLFTEMTEMGFAIFPSQTNFLFAKPPFASAQQWFEWLRERKILVRWFSLPEVKDYLRISIGTEEETATLLEAIREILKR